MDLGHWNSKYNDAIDNILIPRLGNKASDRFKLMARESHQVLIEFLITGHDFEFRIVLEATGFCQSRRRHLVTLLSLIPVYCKGKRQLSEAELLIVVLHLCDFLLINITTLYRQLVLSYIFRDFKVILTGDQLLCNYQLDFLENLFTEPERVSITDPAMNSAFRTISDKVIPMPYDKVFSTAELLNSCTLIGAYFTYFDYKDLIFQTLSEFIQQAVKYTRDDYFIEIPSKHFEAILNGIGQEHKAAVRKLLVIESDDFLERANSHHAFFYVNGNYVSNVNLISRCVYNYKNVSLDRSRKFRIRSGFIFEDRVKSVLSEVGFDILKVKRIQRREFDVLARKNKSIYNFQCKNSFVDISQLEEDPALFAKRNRRLVSFFRSSLKKERSREHLLKKKYKVHKIHHFLISRFPVVTNDPDIILFKDLSNSVFAL